MCICDNIQFYNKYKEYDNESIVFDNDEKQFELHIFTEEGGYFMPINYCPICGGNLNSQLDEYGNLYDPNFENNDLYKCIQIDDFLFIAGRGIVIVCHQVNIKDLKVGMSIYHNGKELHLKGFEYEAFHAGDIRTVGLVFGSQLNMNNIKIGDRLYYKEIKE